MTEKQRKFFYFPAWNRCARICDWVMVRGRLLADLRKQREELVERARPSLASPAWKAGLQVLDYAEQLARQEHRSVTAADLRHACNLVATGGRKSGSDGLTNHEVNRVVTLFDLLQDGENMDCVMKWDHPEIADKEALVKYLRKMAGETTLCAISRNAFGTIFWEDLETQKIIWILKLVKGRKAQPRSGAPEPDMAPAEAVGTAATEGDEPF